MKFCLYLYFVRFYCWILIRYFGNYLSFKWIKIHRNFFVLLILFFKFDLFSIIFHIHFIISNHLFIFYNSMTPHVFLEFYYRSTKYRIDNGLWFHLNHFSTFLLIILWLLSRFLMLFNIHMVFITLKFIFYYMNLIFLWSWL